MSRRGGWSWPLRSFWWWVPVLVLAACSGGWSVLFAESPQPMSEGQPLNPQLGELLNLPWPTLRDDSMLLVTRLRERRQQAGSLLDNLSEAGGKLSYSEELSLKLEQLLSGAVPLLQSLRGDLTGISSSLSGLRMDFSGLQSSLDGYFGLVQGQLREVRGERDAARLQAAAWRIGAYVAGGVAIASLVALVIVIAWRR